MTDLDEDRKTGRFVASVTVPRRIEWRNSGIESLKYSFGIKLSHIVGDGRTYEISSEIERIDNMDGYIQFVLRATVLLRDPWQAEVDEYVSLDVLGESAMGRWHEGPGGESFWEEKRHFVKEGIGWRRTK